MARLNYSVRIIDATGLFIKDLTPVGKVAYDFFESRADEILKAAMNDARKRLRQAAPTRTRKMQRSLRVSKIRQRKHPEGRIVVGYQVTTGRKQFYAPITDQRPGTRVSDWFKDTLEEIQDSREFQAMQDELIDLFADVVRAEYKERIRTSLRAKILSSFPSAKLIYAGPNGSLIRVNIGTE